jgi:hypothetical protein
LPLLAACANADGNPPDAGDPPQPDGRLADRCTPGELATNVGTQVTCTTIDVAAASSANAHCSVYLGWRDSCDGCITDPLKWGFSGGDRCTIGAGVGNTCTTATLGDQPVRLFGLDSDGDVDGNDKLYSAFHCTTPPATTGATTPCPPGEFVVGTNGASVRCAPLAPIVAAYIQTECSLYFGWQDSCNGCASAPGKWGNSNDTTCVVGAGADNTCTKPTLGGEALHLFGLNTDGDVNGDDKLHLGLRCGPGMSAASTSPTMCPAGQFVVGVNPDGTFTCESPVPSLAAYVADRCSVYLGWQDGCDGCTSPPTKWGRVSSNSCMNGLGADNTCTEFPLGGDLVKMFGLSLDGDVDENDAFYVGFRCR